MKGHDFLTLRDITAKELIEILQFSIKLKKLQTLEWQRTLGICGKTLVMLFAKTSTRTRVSFEIAMNHMGGHAINLNWNETNFVKGDIKDEARVLGLYCDAVMARLFAHEQLQKIAEGCEKPVINGLDDLHHPCQALADLLTILEVKGKFTGLKLGWVGDGTNVCNSLMEGTDMVGMRMVVATPDGYEPKVKTVSSEIVRKPETAAKDADVLATDSWVSIGLESEKEKRIKVFKPYQLNSNLVSLAKKDCIILHCLPAQRGYEITSDVLDSPQSKVLQEAENRLYTEKSLLLRLLV
ncbi:MAG: ornithine carbamoyltransferase [Candidatus Bathyarchaeota archaeon]